MLGSLSPTTGPTTGARWSIHGLRLAGGLRANSATRVISAGLRRADRVRGAPCKAPWTWPSRRVLLHYVEPLVRARLSWFRARRRQAVVAIGSASPSRRASSAASAGRGPGDVRERRGPVRAAAARDPGPRGERQRPGLRRRPGGLRLRGRARRARRAAARLRRARHADGRGTRRRRRPLRRRLDAGDGRLDTEVGARRRRARARWPSAGVRGVDACGAARFRYVARRVLSLEPVSAGVEGGATVVVGASGSPTRASGVPAGRDAAAARKVGATGSSARRRPPTRAGRGRRVARWRRLRPAAGVLTGDGGGDGRGSLSGRRRAARRWSCAARTWSSRRRWRAGSRSSTCGGRPTELRCAAPAQSAGAAAFAVVDDRRSLRGDLRVHAAHGRARREPAARRPAHVVTVAGSGFAAYATAACVFGDRRVEAVVTSDTEVVCVAPPARRVAVRVVSGATTMAEKPFLPTRAPSVSNLRRARPPRASRHYCARSGLCRAARRLCFGDATTQALRVSYRTLCSAC